MSRVCFLLLGSVMAGCQSLSTPPEQAYTVEIILISSTSDDKVRITYREYNVLNTVYVKGEPCRYDVGLSELKTIDGNLLLVPNSQC